MIPRRSNRRSKHSSELSEIPNLVKLWLLRILVPLGAHRKFILQNDFQDDALAKALGLDVWIDGDEFDFDQRKIVAHLRKLHREYESAFRHPDLPKKFTDNVSKLSDLVGLTETDRSVLEFAVFMRSEPLLGETAGLLGQLSSDKVPHILSILLDIPEQDMRLALSSKGILACSGLLTVEHDASYCLHGKLELLSSEFADILRYSDADPVTLLRDSVIPSRPTTLKLDDFDHIKTSLKLLLPYMRDALAKRRQGVNIFLHGAPGTGKSELSRLLAKVMKCELFEVASDDEDGHPVDGDERFRAFRAAQTFFTKRRAIILFDEVEDVFNNRSSLLIGRIKRSSPGKASMNRALEENAVPTIWVSNSVDCLDPAYIRRFDIVIELPIPPKRQRERIVRDACEDMLPDEVICRIAEADALAPAVITRAVSVVKCIRSEFAKKDIPKAIEHLIGNTLAAQGHRPVKREDTNRLPETYNPAFINTDSDLVIVAKGLAKTKSGRLCLYGPPGTGKTAFGRWLADRLEVPLCVKRASDLLSKWLGGTEKNIADAFREAEQDGALLLIDEVDSFLQDRRHAQRSWEVTEVNEMLTQMESFPGVFIASTNLMDGLDQAALRRFDLKVKFDFLKPEQAWQLLECHCVSLGIPAPKPQVKRQIARLPLLTPGDFAAVARQNRFRPIMTAAAFIAALEQECLVKEDGQRKAIGFF